MYLVAMATVNRVGRFENHEILSISAVVSVLLHTSSTVLPISSVDLSLFLNAKDRNYGN